MPFLPALTSMRMRAGLIGQQDHASGVQIEVVGVEVGLVARREVVEYDPGGLSFMKVLP